MEVYTANNNNILDNPASDSNLLKPKHPMDTLLKGGSSVFSKIGDLVEGIVIERKGTRMFVDLGPRGTGIVYGREYYAAQEIIRSLKPGDKISAKVVELDNEEGYVELSLKEAGEERRWADLKKMMQEGDTLDLPVLEANRGGLILETKGIKGFLPASQLSQKNYPRIEGGDKEKIYLELQKLVGQNLRVKILDVNPAENKLIFTEKSHDTEEIRNSIAKYKVGDEVEGEITSVVDFGAFMKFGDLNLEGLIHISEIDWMLVGDPREVLKQGNRVRAKIIDIQGDKVSFSLKRMTQDPWEQVSQYYSKGQVVKGRAVKLNPFGIFVALEAKVDFDLSKKISCGIQGLVHVSEFGTEEKMKESLELGKEYDFKILLIDPKEHRISLGIVKNEP